MRKKQHITKPTDEQYRAIPRISNSDLSALHNRMFGIKFFGDSTKAFAFGTAVHELILEPHTILNLPEGVDIALVQEVARTARDTPSVKWALRFSKKEEIILWDCPVTGLPLKSKLDIVYKNKTVYDIKTTTCGTIQAFAKTAESYGYDRQAAFYLDSVGAKNFVFVVLSKTKKDTIFIVTCTKEFIEQGRKKYKKLLKTWSDSNHKLPNT